MLFSDYDLLVTSGLFDAKYYLASNPDVAALAIDPLLHYLEHGAREGRNPHPEFHSAFYLEQCRLIGEEPANPLVHFVTIGAARGLKPRKDADPSALYTPPIDTTVGPASIINIDWPRLTNGIADTPISGSLNIQGWVSARAGVAELKVTLDGKHAVSVAKGLRRDDVASAFPNREDALLSGFAALVPHWLLSKGVHHVLIDLKDRNGKTSVIEFRVHAEDTPEGNGPWSLRRKMSQAELGMHMKILASLKWRPEFCVLLAVDPTRAAIVKARRSLGSLREQVYGNWRVVVTVRGNEVLSTDFRKRLLGGFEDIAERIELISSRQRKKPRFFVEHAKQPTPARHLFVCTLAAGGELGCDALLEFAIASGMEPTADFFYADDRCISPVTQSLDVYFKPGWSPDLLLSTNYIGRTWCADWKLLERTGLTPGEWGAHGDYDLILRATELAQTIYHIPKVLCEQSDAPADNTVYERKALRRALERRGVSAVIEKGCANRIYRIKRQLLTQGLVSIIIPTCAARGLIKTCIETLRARTAYRNFEIICIENIPKQQQTWKRWVRKHADKVIETSEPFNWSRFNNLAAAQASGEFLLFLNDDVEITQPEWLEALLEHGQRPEVGVVGPQLLYPDGNVQHAGVALTHAVGISRHIFRHSRADDPGYFGLALTQRNVIAVTGACLLTRRETFSALGGFEEAHGIVNNDVDYCLRSWKRGLLNVFTPYARLVHHELVSRGDLGDAFDSKAFDTAWRDTFLKGDPYLNPNLSRDQDSLSPEREPVRVISTGRPLFLRSSIRRILVVKLDHIGDCVTALPALHRLKSYFPKASISVLVGSVTKTIWSSQPAVDEIIEFNYFHARSGLGKKEIGEKELLDLQEQLEGRRFDLAVDLRKSPDTRHVLQHTGARFLAGFDYQGQCAWLDVALEWEGDSNRAPKRQPIGDDLINLIDALTASCEADRTASGSMRPPPLKMNAERRRLFARRVVCIHPCAGTETRQWPVEHFSALVDLIAPDQSLNIALIGSPDEMDVAKSVLAGAKRADSVFNLIGKLSLSELPSLLAGCTLFIGNNSGPQHMAAALGTPTIGVHSGVVDPHEWGPQGSSAIAIRRDMICSPCYISKRNDCPRNLACLSGLGAGEVYLQCSRLLKIGISRRRQR